MKSELYSKISNTTPTKITNQQVQHHPLKNVQPVSIQQTMTTSLYYNEKFKNQVKIDMT